MKTYDKILSFQNKFYKQLYEDGIQQRNQLNSKFTPTITILSAEIGGIIWIVFKLMDNITNNQNKIEISHLCMFFFLVLTLIFFGAAIVYFILCFTHYNFSYPDPNKAKTFIEDNKSQIGEYSEKEILNNVIECISNDYINASIINCKETNRHSEYLNRCYICIVSVLVFMIVDFVAIVLM